MDSMSISISQLKTNPAKAISQAEEYPMAVKNREKIKAYILGKELFEKIITCIEEYSDKQTIKKTDFEKGRDFEDIASELNI